MNVTITFDEHKVRNTEKIEDIKVLMLKGEKGDAGMTPEDVMDVVNPYLANYAPLNSPALTGTPTAPTATAGSDTTQIATTAYVKNEVDSKLSSTYKAKGSVAFASLPALIAANEGNVYNVTDAFTTTNDFVEGSGKSYPAGTNVVIVNTTGTTYKYDVLSGFVDLSGYLTSSDAANTYLSQSDASSTYLTQSDASSTYLTQSDASSTYLTQSDASSTYATQTALGNTDAKVGSGTLDIGSDLTDGVNQLNSNLTTYTDIKGNGSGISNVSVKYNAKLKVAYISGTMTGITLATGFTSLVTGFISSSYLPPNDTAISSMCITGGVTAYVSKSGNLCVYSNNAVSNGTLVLGGVISYN